MISWCTSETSDDTLLKTPRTFSVPYEKSASSKGGSKPSPISCPAHSSSMASMMTCMSPLSYWMEF